MVIATISVQVGAQTVLGVTVNYGGDQGSDYEDRLGLAVQTALMSALARVEMPLANTVAVADETPEDAKRRG